VGIAKNPLRQSQHGLAVAFHQALKSSAISVCRAHQQDIIVVGFALGRPNPVVLTQRFSLVNHSSVPFTREMGDSVRQNRPIAHFLPGKFFPTTSQLLGAEC
jgi:hypothetical protein